MKPSNIVFIRGEAKLADIGLVAKHENSLSLVGAEGYMPPLGGATPQADLFALGKVLYEMSTGLDRLKCPRLPALATLPARERRGILELNRVVLKACHQSPKNRYATAATLKVDLLLLQEGSSLRLRRQLKLALVTLAALVVVLGVALVFQRTWLWARAQEAAAGHVRHIYEAIVERQGLRKSGWFIKNWNHLEQAAKLRWSDDLAEHAGAVMAGEDARLIAAIKGIGGSSLVFDDQGRLFVGGLPDGQAWRWSKQKPAGPTHFTVSGDGPVIIGADGNPLQFTLQSPVRLILRELSTGLIRQEFQLPVDTVVGGRGNPNLVIAADGSRVAAAIQLPDGTPQFAVWDAASGALLAHRAEDVTDLAFSADGVHLARGHRDGVVSISRVSQMDRGTNFVAGRGAVRCLAFAPVPLESDHAFAPPEKRWLVAVSVGGGTISIHESDTGQVRSVCRGSHYDVFAVAFHPNGRVLASGGRGPLHLWDVDSGRALLSIEEDGYPVDFPRDLAFSRDGRYLTVVTKKAFAGPLLAVWEIQNGHGIDTLRGLSAQAGRVWWSADGTKLAALAHNWELGVWDVPTGRLLRIFDQQDGRSADNAAAAFSPDGRQMAFASGESARLYDLGSGAVLAERRLPLGYADQLRFLDEAHLLLLRRERGPGQRSEITWRVRNILLPGANWSQPIYEQQDTNWFAYNTASAPNSDYFAIVGRTAGTNLNGIYRVIDWRDGRQVMEVPTPLRMELCIPALAPNGRFLTHPIGPDNKSRLLRLPGGEPMGEVDTPWAISPAGDSFASPANNRACLLFGRRGAAYALKLGMDSRMVLGAEFSPDGSRLAWGTRDGTVLVAYLEKVKTRVQKLRERQ